MSLEHTNTLLTVKQIVQMMQAGQMNTNHEIQRGIVYNNTERSSLIDSIVHDFPTGQLFSRKMDIEGNALYYIMDGKQRVTSVLMFVEGKFKLVGVDTFSYYDILKNEVITENVSGKYFKDLSEGLKDKILSATFDMVFFPNLTDKEARELFKRINSGKALTSRDKLLASSENAAELIMIANHPVFDIILSEKGKEQKKFVVYMCKSWCMLNMDIHSISFDGRTFNKYVEKMHITEEQSIEITSIFDYMQEVFAEYKKNKNRSVSITIGKETHFVSLVPFVKIAVEKDIPIEKFMSWVEHFFLTECDIEYFNASSSGSARTVNIVKRNECLKKSFDSYFGGE